ncbi:protein CURVATURE THYLAKOID 1B, chloroplastic-like [Iris pallida]|uniref:Protein CURVATURE THYLAKOID 1B, chloroplastic-like n=1 Tax=Iris pallida TaxID=29817 RepID=A0AAX6GIN0_IRIPA|nr:protein CURVATURE THYLAKOID 1B, chloroplastic-like [Iris pallida]KAJ6828145.1 protein CURVATURE THYLAKOID 1B, chloroplastic-like [Iris pallida]
MAATKATTSAAIGTPACLADGRAAAAAAAPHSVGLPVLPLSPPSVRTQASKTTAYCRKIARNVVAMATGEAPTEVVTELPEIVKTIQDAWDKVEDKYAVSSLAVAGVVALWGSTGMISAIDRLPLVPGILELVGIGYTGWFAYRNLVFKPDREALIAKIKSTYGEIIGSS